MNGVDPRYVAARRVLLDALFALENQLDALVIAGAQAVYLRTGDADLAVTPFSTDADLALDRRHLAPDPPLETAMTQAGSYLALCWGSTGSKSGLATQGTTRAVASAAGRIRQRASTGLGCSVYGRGNAWLVSDGV